MTYVDITDYILFVCITDSSTLQTSNIEALSIALRYIHMNRTKTNADTVVFGNIRAKSNFPFRE